MSQYTQEQINQLIIDLRKIIDLMPTGDHEKDRSDETIFYEKFIRDCADGNFTKIEDIKKIAEVLILTQNKGFLRW